MKAFNKFFEADYFQLNKKLKNAEKYFAHTLDSYENKETLSAHTELVLKYFIELCKNNNLEKIIDAAITNYVTNGGYNNREEIADFIKLLFINSVYFHDYGKVNENFQIKKMGNPQFQNANNGIGSQHSILSAYLFIGSHFYEVINSAIANNDKNRLLGIVLIFAYPILKHHSFFNDVNETEFNDEVVGYLKDYRMIFSNIHSNDDKVNFFLRTTDYYDKIQSSLKIDFNLFFLLKLNYSLLTAADYYATNEYMNGMAINDFGMMKEELREKIISNTYKISYNKKLNEQFDYFKGLQFDELDKFSESNLNLLRQKLSAEVIINIRDNISKKLFYIEAPTGSGKTNLSLLALTEILRQRNDITKIFYVFPFTTIITQTYKSLTENLGLTFSEITEVHSKASFKGNAATTDEQDGEYDVNWKNYIDNLFVNYPFVLLSHIKFFDILISNEKEANYLLHRIANSVVIIDELQSYNPSEWDKINYLLQKYSEAMNITFIVMSATLPKISKLFLDKTNISKDEFVYLVQNKKEYFSNPNFKDRVKIKLDYLKEGEDLNRLCELLHKHSEEYYLSHHEVKSMIEFITKTKAHKFYKNILEAQLFCDYELYLITGTILEPRRKEIINYLKSNESKKKKILVICTQVIEAGLDIDMDLGFKDKAILDSEEQFAGRINRNATKINSELFIFNTGDRQKVYVKDLRYKPIDESLYNEIIGSRDFDLLYEKVFERINKANNDPYLSDNLSDFISQINSLRYGEVKKKFQLIKDNTVSVFVPSEVDKKYFNSAEIKFLIQYKPEMCNSETIDGEAVWDVYESIISNKERGFSSKIDIKIISTIISKFTFNVWNNQNTINLLFQRSDEGEKKYGFVKLSKHFYKDIYSYETGLITDLETDVNIL